MFLRDLIVNIISNTQVENLFIFCCIIVLWYSNSYLNVCKELVEVVVVGLNSFVLASVDVLLYLVHVNWVFDDVKVVRVSADSNNH